mgnify:CR=1 FL=1
MVYKVEWLSDIPVGDKLLRRQVAWVYRSGSTPPTTDDYQEACEYLSTRDVFEAIDRIIEMPAPMSLPLAAGFPKTIKDRTDGFRAHPLISHLIESDPFWDRQEKTHRNAAIKLQATLLRTLNSKKTAWQHP